MSGSTDPRTPCIVGVGSRTWHPDETGSPDAPEPLDMWEIVSAAANHDAGASVLRHVDDLNIVYCHTWQYDDPAARLCDRLHVAPRRRAQSGIGGTTPQVLVQEAAARLWRGESEIALVVGGEALDTQRRYKRRGERYPYSFPPETKPTFPWEAPFHPAEVAHEVFQAWLTFAIFDNARRAHLGLGLDEYRSQLGEQWQRFTQVAAMNPEAWFPIERSAAEIITPTAENRLVGSPYTKFMISMMDVDMAAAVLMTTEARADALGVPFDRRVYPRGWQYATDPLYVAEHPDLWRSPAMHTVSDAALGAAGVGIDDVAHLDLYSCFASSVNFMRDALGLTPDDPRRFTITGGLPYHGGAASNYLTHAIAQMVRVLRDDPGAFGLVTGVGMHMTKHVAGVYSTTPGPVQMSEPASAPSCVPIVDRFEGRATVSGYSVVHGREGPEWALVVCDLPDAAGRAYARVEQADLLVDASSSEWVGRLVSVTPHPDRPGVNMVTA